MHRKQKTVKTDYTCEDRLEAESNMKVPSIVQRRAQGKKAQKCCSNASSADPTWQRHTKEW